MKVRSFLTRLSAVTLAAVMVIGMTGCGNSEKKTKQKEVVEGGEQYQEYVLSIMDTNYKNNSAKYCELTGASAEDAAATYEGCCQELGFLLEDSLSVKRDVVTADLTSQYIEMGRMIYAQTKYEAVSVYAEEGNDYTVTVSITPINVFGTIGEAFENAVYNWNLSAKNGDMDKLTASQYEQSYGELISGTVSVLLPNLQYNDPVTVDITLDYDDASGIYVISDEDMAALASTVVNMSR